MIWKIVRMTIFIHPSVLPIDRNKHATLYSQYRDCGAIGTACVFHIPSILSNIEKHVEIIFRIAWKNNKLKKQHTHIHKLPQPSPSYIQGGTLIDGIQTNTNCGFYFPLAQADAMVYSINGVILLNIIKNANHTIIQSPTCTQQHLFLINTIGVSIRILHLIFEWDTYTAAALHARAKLVLQLV